MPGVVVGEWAPPGETHPACPSLPATGVPEVVQEWRADLAGQLQGERPHQVIYPLLGRKPLQGGEHPFLGSRLVPQDLIHLRGRVW